MEKTMIPKVLDIFDLLNLKNLDYDSIREIDDRYRRLTDLGKLCIHHHYPDGCEGKVFLKKLKKGYKLAIDLQNSENFENAIQCVFKPNGNLRIYGITYHNPSLLFQTNIYTRSKTFTTLTLKQLLIKETHISATSRTLHHINYITDQIKRLMIKHSKWQPI